MTASTRRKAAPPPVLQLQVRDDRIPDRHRGCSPRSPPSLATTAGQGEQNEGNQQAAEQLLLAATAGQELLHHTTSTDLAAVNDHRRSFIQGDSGLPLNLQLQPEEHDGEEEEP
jgi:hypothetical protein